MKQEQKKKTMGRPPVQIKYVWLECSNCGITFMRDKYNYLHKKGLRDFCSVECLNSQVVKERKKRVFVKYKVCKHCKKNMIGNDIYLTYNGGYHKFCKICRAAKYKRVAELKKERQQKFLDKWRKLYGCS